MKLSAAQKNALDELNKKVADGWNSYISAKSVWGDREPTKQSKSEITFVIGSSINRRTVRSLVSMGILIVDTPQSLKLAPVRNFNYYRDSTIDISAYTAALYRLSAEFITE